MHPFLLIAYQLLELLVPSFIFLYLGEMHVVIALHSHSNHVQFPVMYFRKEFDLLNLSGFALSLRGV